MEALCIQSNVVSSSLATAFGAHDAAETIAFWWLGQAGFAIRAGGTLLLIDPYLSDSLAEKYRNSELKHLRMMPIPVAPTAISTCDWVLCTHGHTDHMDAQTIQGLQVQSSPHFLVPRAEAQRAQDRGVPRGQMHTINAGERLQLTGDVTVEAVASAHEQLETDIDGNHRYLGYVIQLGDVRLYHSGDTIPYAGLAEMLAGKGIDVAFLPINGRDAFRLAKGVPGNLTVEEAVALCRAAQIPALVCHHFEMFEFNTVDRSVAAAQLVALAPDIRWILPEINVTYSIPSEAEG